MVDCGNSVFYAPKDRKVHADTARLNFGRAGHGDHVALLNVFTQWADSNFSAQWCFENFVQIRTMKRARDIREQLASLCDRVEVERKSNAADHEAICKAITGENAFVSGAAYRR
jgi:pre-mRNA-splicing factor ATP-dependent RNA helicase DHX16